MTCLQILVCLFLLMTSFDFVRYFLRQTSEAEPSIGSGGRKNSTVNNGVLGSDFGETISQWLIGGLCLLSLFLLRLVFKRSLPKTDEITQCFYQSSEIKADDHRPHRKESFVTTNLSESTCNGFEESICDLPGQLSPAQLQVLLEELKFTVDEKFEEIDAWVDINEQGSKLWGKRLERVETELSYIRHQIFILMSCNAKQSSTLCIRDVPDTKDQSDTLRELSSILAQVKKQYNENESKDKISEQIGESSGDLEINLNKQENTADKYTDNCLEELKRIDSEIKKTILEDFSLEYNLNESSTKITPIEDELKNPKITEIGKGDTLSSEISGINEIKDKTINLMSLNGKEPIVNYSKESQNTFENSNITIIKNLDSYSESKLEVKRNSFLQGKVDERGDSSSFNAVTSESKNELFNEGGYYSLNSFMDEPSQMSTNLFDNSTMRFLENSSVNVRDRSRSISPKRSVRFAQGRDVSPSKSPTWLSVKRDDFSDINDIGGSDTKVTSSNKLIKGIRESSYPPAILENKRPSRRTVLERELTILERSVSPSPTRNRSNLKHIRSKVGDYIRGNKKQIYEKNN